MSLMQFWLDIAANTVRQDDQDANKYEEGSAKMGSRKAPGKKSALSRSKQKPAVTARKDGHSGNG